ncbi:GerW family sporulation protein [Clostridium sp. C2-6-12]|uniref:GerW family sporulation protein n=1 Tax=Clostridium sp. C2-6-12 TaxID=2698832 RepID=UPI00136A64B9|nr:GerW family sporulation protein [Clostridium sp. C2-6-12]
MSNEQQVENLIKSTMENLKSMVDVNTVIGKGVETKDGSYIIPVSKLSFGFASGGSEYSNPNNTPNNTVFPFGGGSGAGVSVRPVAFLVVKEDGVRMLPVAQDTTYDRIVDTVPQVLDIIKSLVKDLCNKNKNSTTGNNNKSNNAENNSTVNMNQSNYSSDINNI